ncbi:solute carrier family 26 protein [Arenibacter sp. GZD96]|uniref:SulP family inorganic anion transporter n=1 Tax=Aurantibrevibacter litoralis TaxID=3106030 RepID=UPI002AFE61D8|nr:solute carrier family 26 protein [Arenibacter sp. GZD-96]MEA1785829.1 solute carrier family 26 protein [Arenibacter sp. GZD-96]
MQKFLPILDWLPHYKRSFFRKDLVAGVSTAIILIPQGMAYALIAGLPAVYGLYAALLPILIYALLGTSRRLAVGPVAMDSLLLAAALGTFAINGVENYIAMALLLTFMVGAIQLILGILRMGFLVNFLSKPVISGFTSAAALIIIFSQLKHLFGVNVPQSSHIQELLLSLFAALPQTNWISILVGCSGILLILILKYWNSNIPAILIAVILGVVTVYFFNLTASGISVLGAVPSGLPSFNWPTFNWLHVQELSTMALTIALIGYMELVSIGKALEEKTNEETIDANQELIALGTANLFGSLFQSYAVSASLSRSAINNEAGATTPMASIISVALVGLTLLFFTPLFYYLPNTILAAIIVVSVTGLIDIRFPMLLWKHNRDEFVLLLITFVMTLTIGIKEGILFGVLFSLLLMVYRTSRPHFAVLGKIRGSYYYRNISRFKDEIEVRNDLLIVRFDAQLFFGNQRYFKKELAKFIKTKGTDLRAIILNAEAINYIDATATDMLVGLIQELQENNIAFFISGAIGPTRDIIFNSAIIKLLHKDHLFANTQDAVSHYDNPTMLNDLSEKLAHQNRTQGN